MKDPIEFFPGDPPWGEYLIKLLVITASLSFAALLLALAANQRGVARKLGVTTLVVLTPSLGSLQSDIRVRGRPSRSNSSISRARHGRRSSAATKTTTARPTTWTPPMELPPFSSRQTIALFGCLFEDGAIGWPS